MSNRRLNGPKPICRIAKFEYIAEDPDEELSFNEGDVLEVLGKSEDNGWLKGKIRGTSRVALFPMNYTVPYEEEDDDDYQQEEGEATEAFNNGDDENEDREQKHEEYEEEEEEEEEEEDDFDEYYPPKRTNRLVIPALNHVTLSRPKDTSKFAPQGKLNVPLPVLNHVDQQPSNKEEVGSEPKGVLQLPVLRKVEIPDKQQSTTTADGDNAQFASKLELPQLRKVEVPTVPIGAAEESTSKTPSFIQERSQLRHVSILVKSSSDGQQRRGSAAAIEEEKNRLPIPQLRKVSLAPTPSSYSGGGNNNNFVATNSTTTTTTSTSSSSTTRSNVFTPMGFLPINTNGGLNHLNKQQSPAKSTAPTAAAMSGGSNNVIESRRPSALGALGGGGTTTSSNKTFIPMPPAQTYASYIPTSSLNHNNKNGVVIGPSSGVGNSQVKQQSTKITVLKPSEMAKQQQQQQSEDKQFDQLLESKGHHDAGLEKISSSTTLPPPGFDEDADKSNNNNNSNNLTSGESKPPLAGSVKIAGLRKHGKNTIETTTSKPTSAGVRTVSKQIPPRSLTMTEPPPSEFYTADVDSYSCKAQVSKTGKISEKIETFEITRADRSKVTLTIKQISGAPSASLEAVIQPFVKLSPGELDRIAQEHGTKVIAFCQFHFGRRVGDGECWSLAQKALEYADCAPPIGYNFGQQIELKDVKPGDVMQFKSCVFESPGAGKHFAGNPHHTAIVAGQVAGSMIPVFEQNPKPCSLSTYDLSTLVSGQVTFFRPLPL